jgi:hypothetical protein
MNSILRQSLSEITLDLEVGTHAARIDALREIFDHSILVVESEHPVERYTCGVHAFCLVEEPTYVEIAGVGFGRTFAGADFINFVLQRNLLIPRDVDEVIDNDLIIYFENGVFRHVGRTTGGRRVLSKWGIGLLYEHEVFEVPATYGDEVRYFCGPDPDACFNFFIQYAENEGFVFGPD